MGYVEKASPILSAWLSAFIYRRFLSRGAWQPPRKRNYDNFICAFDFLPGEAGGVYPAIL